MKTPITDKLNMKFHEDESASFVDSYVGMRNLARRLEHDRAALMEALSKLLIEVGPQKDDLILSAIVRSAASTLAAARANFPNED